MTHIVRYGSFIILIFCVIAYSNCLSEAYGAGETGKVTLSTVGTPPQANKVESNYSWSNCANVASAEFCILKGTNANRPAATVAWTTAFPTNQGTGTGNQGTTGSGGIPFGTGDTIFGRLRIKDACGNVILEVFSVDFTVP